MVWVRLFFIDLFESNYLNIRPVEPKNQEKDWAGILQKHTYF